MENGRRDKEIHDPFFLYFVNFGFYHILFSLFHLLSLSLRVSPQVAKEQNQIHKPTYAHIQTHVFPYYKSGI